MTIQLWRDAAFKTYKEMMDPHHTPGGFMPPPFQMRDKEWTYQLRQMWPDITRIQISNDDENGPTYRDMRKWCLECGSRWWVNGGGYNWYFEDPAIATMFKLTFGGAV